AHDRPNQQRPKDRPDHFASLHHDGQVCSALPLQPTSERSSRRASSNRSCLVMGTAPVQRTCQSATTLRGSPKQFKSGQAAGAFYRRRWGFTPRVSKKDGENATGLRRTDETMLYVHVSTGRALSRA